MPEFPDKEPDPDLEDGAQNDNSEEQEPLHILSHDRSLLRLHEWETVTGLDGRLLVLRPDILQQNKSFVIGVTVKHRSEWFTVLSAQIRPALEFQ